MHERHSEDQARLSGYPDVQYPRAPAESRCIREIGPGSQSVYVSRLPALGSISKAGVWALAEMPLGGRFSRRH